VARSTLQQYEEARTFEGTNRASPDLPSRSVIHAAPPKDGSMDGSLHVFGLDSKTDNAAFVSLSSVYLYRWPPDRRSQIVRSIDRSIARLFWMIASQSPRTKRSAHYRAKNMPFCTSRRRCGGAGFCQPAPYYRCFLITRRHQCFPLCSDCVPHETNSTYAYQTERG
jgi:hypothetical protein